MWDHILYVILLTAAAAVYSKPQQQQQQQQPQTTGNNYVNVQQQLNANGPVKDGSPYQVTENTLDHPDNRTLAPIDPTYGIKVPLNLGNNTNINNNGHPVTEASENHEKDATEKVKLKKNSFSYVQIQAELDDQVLLPNFLPNYNSQTPSESQQNNIGFKRFLDGIKSYIFSMKKGLVDGLHSWYNKNSINYQARKEIDKFYRSFHEDSDPDFEGSGQIDNWLNKEDVQKEILDIYKSLNEESAEDGDTGDDKNSGDEYEDYSDDYDHHPHFHHHHHHHRHNDKNYGHDEHDCK